LRSVNWSLVDGRIKVTIFLEERYLRVRHEYLMRAGGPKMGLSTAEQRGGQPDQLRVETEPKLSLVT
jgi:hypothetical protein